VDDAVHDVHGGHEGLDVHEEEREERGSEHDEEVLSGNRNISLDDDEMALLGFQDPEQPSYVSATDHCPHLTVVGRHWEPKNWERESTLKEFVDEVLEIHYEMQ
jgi:hypothetical protein